MSFGRSILLLVTVVCAVLVPLFVGYGLASRAGTPFVIGAALLAFAAVGTLLLVRSGRSRRNEPTRDQVGAPAG